MALSDRGDFVNDGDSSESLGRTYPIVFVEIHHNTVEQPFLTNDVSKMTANHNIFVEQVIQRLDQKRLFCWSNIQQSTKWFQTDCHEQRQIHMFHTELTCLQDNLAGTFAELNIWVVSDIQH